MSSVAPDWSLISALVRAVKSAPGGGIHRDELAAQFQLPPRGPSMRDALGVAYRLHRVDFCQQYVVMPGRKR